MNPNQYDNKKKLDESVAGMHAEEKVSANLKMRSKTEKTNSQAKVPSLVFSATAGREEGVVECNTRHAGAPAREAVKQANKTMRQYDTETQ